ncbi:Dyp-type peroxidase [Pyxidicoccus xibeiensis]|uniref:Dyp-type peroxidase domain-containing protein n=1 Tax=Pyxidicoccus xibeiensis TaxID=2906759 RepID=UPI0020A6FA48|nr:Dyp-type peroxidase domain-containing protein [Pyxidicoccus xibeiensis]MCP3136885.1 Dyp-type peroxidase [Pyxidicoccus xibeiensis]
MRPQEGLFHPPGDYSALVIWRLSRSSAAAQVREATADAYAALRRAGDIQAVLAFDAPLVSPTADVEAGPPPLPRRGAHASIPSTQAQVLVQLAARSRERLVWALRRTAAVVAGVLVPEEEVLGGRLGEGLMPATLPGSRRAPSRDEVQHSAVIPTGPLAGGAWLLYLRFQHDTSRPPAPPPRARMRVVRSDGEAPAPASHASDAGAAPGLIRRSFPFRQRGEEGLAFLATSADPTRFHRVLDSLLGAPGTPPDALLSRATPVGGGMYLAPSRDWLLAASGDALQEAAS